ncbi:hypothetical protein E5676_scaffold306G001360 [Cucumis melo var. makuwa]|uniref:Putative plant transposon protein domain-containing protein n=1 Tax=Cucumis melo var. makuwa TaxID=1194695 RepID=A0A5D3D2B5_CUCMM|nr:hypothetical protein E6C27_scaffold67G003500 [Cucumis melo var. makuwa]TYK17865.1 hypothetical protein E5676_scaffold306G001360 [Cucumis melo var. makuwa]
MFYKGYINEEECYAMVKGHKVDFRLDTINAFFGLETNEIGHAIFKNPQERDLEYALKRVAWSGTKWDITITRRYHLFLHNLNIEVSIWLVFEKKKIIPTRHDIAISMERIMLVYCIMEEIPMNIGEIISEHIIAWVKHLHGARPFSYLIEKFYLKACLALNQLPQVEVKDGVWPVATLHHIIVVHKNKTKLKHLKTK